ncbi:MAG TPA: hypothetical protein VKB69_15235 [Micromonosporaceae bacterium]|nr:hypothetical protein [Micromonosporaceae bacterium]
MFATDSGIPGRDEREWVEGKENAMGSLHGGNGGEDPSSPGSDGLPDLPPEWAVVIPDDLAELDREAVALRREQRRSSRQSRWRKRLGVGSPSADGESPPVGAPLLIMSIAIIAALTSLFAITLSTRAAPVTEPKPIATPASTQQMIDLTLSDAQGKEVHIRQTLPAVILLLDGCTCGQLIADTVKYAPPRVSVLVVDRTAPVLPSAVHATALADPEQALLATYAGGVDRQPVPGAVPTAVLVNSEGTVAATVRPATAVSSFQAKLFEIAG